MLIRNMCENFLMTEGLMNVAGKSRFKFEVLEQMNDFTKIFMKPKRFSVLKSFPKKQLFAATFNKETLSETWIRVLYTGCVRLKVANYSRPVQMSTPVTLVSYS